MRKNRMVKYQVNVVSVSQTRKMSAPSFNNNNRTASKLAARREELQRKREEEDWAIEAEMEAI